MSHALEEPVVRAIVENISDMVLLITPDGEVRYRSPSTRECIGLDCEATAELDFFASVHPDDCPAVRQAVADVAHAGDAGIVLEFRLAQSSAECRHVQGSFKSLRQDPSVDGVLVTLRDFTERKELEREREHAHRVLEQLVEERTAELTHTVDALQQEIEQRMQAEDDRKQLESRLFQVRKMEAIGTLAGGIAHDFNNILAAIVGYAELAQENTANPELVSDDLMQILRAAYRARGLVKQILAFSRHSEEENKAMHIAPIVKETIKLLRATLPSTIAVRERMRARTTLVVANPAKVQRVVLNLCTNAAQALGGRTGGYLEIEVRDVEVTRDSPAPVGTLLPGEYVELVVRDNGIGMEAEVMERCFEPFFTTNTVGEGSGMGLAVVHGIVQGYKGAAVAASRPGEGATFRVLLPSVGHADTEEDAEVQAEPAVRGSGRILLVDDEPDIVSIGRRLLESLGYDLVGFTSPLDALNAIRNDIVGFDLMLTDMTMPHMTGLELAEEATKLAPDLPIVLCTGHSEDLCSDSAMAAGIREFVMKPLSKKELADVVARTIR